VRESARERMGLKVKGGSAEEGRSMLRPRLGFWKGLGTGSVYVDRDDRGGRRRIVSPRRRQSVSAE
jgi:hypothetical protein